MDEHRDELLGDVEDENPHAGADPFIDHSAKNDKNNNNNNDSGNDNDDDLFATEEGFDLNETRPDSDDMSSANLLSSDRSKSDDEKNERSSFFKGKRPTSAGEPSANVPPKINVSVTCEIRWVIFLLTLILFLITLFDSNYIENSFQSLLHWTNDRESGLGSVGLIFCIFDVSLLMIAGGADIMLILGCGFLFKFEIGATLYMVCSFIASVICFIIGKTLYRDSWYTIWSKHEIYRLLDRSIQDYGPWLTFSLRLCPFLPMGFIAYILSFTSVTLKQYMLGHVFGSIAYVAAIALVGSETDFIEDLTLTTYTKGHQLEYAVVVTSSVLFALIFCVVAFLIYSQVHRLMTGENRDNMERSITESEESDSEDSSDKENDVDLEAGDNPLLVGLDDDDDNIGGARDIEMAQYNNSVNGSDNNNNNNNKEKNKNNNKSKKKKKKKKKKSSSNKKSVFSWEDDSNGFGLDSPFQEGGGAGGGGIAIRGGKFGQTDGLPTQDHDAAPMDPMTPRR